MPNDTKTFIIPTDADSLDVVLGSLFSETTSTNIPDFVRADGEDIAIILADPSSSSERDYDARIIPDGTTAVLGIGNPDVPPDSGIITLRYDGDGPSVATLDYTTLSGIALANALNNLSARAVNKVSVVQSGVDYIISDLNPGARPVLLVDASLLVPLSGAVVTIYRNGTDADPVEGTPGQNQVVVLTIAQSNFAVTNAFTPFPPAAFELDAVQTGIADIPAAGQNPAVPGLPSIQRVTLSPTPYGGVFVVDGKAIPWGASSDQFALAYYGNATSGALVAKVGPSAWQFSQAINGPKVSEVSVDTLLVPTGFLFTLNLSTYEFFLAFAKIDGDNLTAKISLRVTFPGKLPKTYLLASVSVFKSILDTGNLVSAAIQGYPSAQVVNSGLAEYASQITSAVGGGSVTDISGIDDTYILTYAARRIREYVTNPGVGLTTWILEPDGDDATGARSIPAKNHATNARSWRQRG